MDAKVRFLNTQVGALRDGRVRSLAGDMFGIELECEGKKVDAVPGHPIHNDWLPHKDGSLRNHHGSSCEWVFNGPVGYKQSIERIDSLFDYFDERKAKLVCSNRTSTHVHFNMSDKSVYQVLNLYILYTMLEDILDTFCGEDRKGNLFCLSTRKAPYQLLMVEKAFNDWQNFADFGDAWRYTSLNLCSLNKFGTVEFRGMRGVDNKQDLIQWLDILNEFTQYACYKMGNPTDLIQELSQKAPEEFLRGIFSKESFVALTKGWDMQELHYSMYEGLRLVQPLSHKIGERWKFIQPRVKDFWAEEAAKKAPPPLIKQVKKRGIPRDVLDQWLDDIDRAEDVVPGQVDWDRFVEEEAVRAQQILNNLHLRINHPAQPLNIRGEIPDINDDF